MRKDLAIPFLVVLVIGSATAAEFWHDAACVVLGILLCLPSAAFFWFLFRILRGLANRLDRRV